jgi:hypothetical protein
MTARDDGTRRVRYLPGMILRPRSLPLLLVFGVFAGCRAPSAGRPQVANHTGGGISAVPNISPIRAIDWMNRTYQTGDAEYTVSAGTFEYAYDEEGNIVAADYQPADPDGYVERGFFSVTEPVYADVDGDGIEEAVIILLENTGGTGMFSGIDVYTLRDGKETVLGGIPGGDRGDGGISDVRVEGQVVIVERFMSQDGDGACCPSKLQTERWRWDGKTFVEDEGARRLTDHAVE